MDSLFAIKGKGFVLVAFESSVIHSIQKLKNQEDKSYVLDDKTLLAVAGEAADRDNFSSFIQRNVQFLKFKNNSSLLVRETAEFVRTKLAEFIRKSPFQANTFVAGFDSVEGAQLYWLDYLGTLAEVNHGGHGYASYFVSSILANFWRPDLTEAQALDITSHCINELRTRFIVDQANFTIKIIDEKGIRIIQ